MTHGARFVISIAALLTTGCAAPALSQRREAAAPAFAALREGRFDVAGERAGAEIGRDGANPGARLVRAVVRYKKSMHQLALDARSFVGGAAAGGINLKLLRRSLEEAESELASVDDDLSAASADPGLAVELCLACWEIDWNGDGRIDARDRRLFEIEEDEHGDPIPEGDPRRRPTFRFDAGDVSWARAFVSFQRAAADVVLAYDFSEYFSDSVIAHGPSRTRKIVLHLRHPERVAAARERILVGLDHSDAARRSYLAETDDDREWVPNPRQKSHPMPLPVDQALYDTWEAVLGDVRRLVLREEGLAAADLIALADPHLAERPRGFIDLGSMLSRPRDITLDVRELERVERLRDVDGTLKALLGDHYVSDMKPSPLPRRLLRMKGEIERSEEGLGRKLRYLFWLN